MAAALQRGEGLGIGICLGITTINSVGKYFNGEVWCSCLLSPRGYKIICIYSGDKEVRFRQYAFHNLIVAPCIVMHDPFGTSRSKVVDGLARFPAVMALCHYSEEHVSLREKQPC